MQACPGAFRHLSTPECRCYEARVRTDHLRREKVNGDPRLARALPAPAVRRGRAPRRHPRTRRAAAACAACLARGLRSACRRGCAPRRAGPGLRRAGCGRPRQPAPRGAGSLRFRPCRHRRARGPGAGRYGRRRGGRRSLRLRRGRRARGALARRALPGGAPRALCRGAGRSDGPLYPARCERGASAPSRHRHPRARPHARRARPGCRRVLGSHFGAADVAPITRQFSYARFFGMEEHRLRHRRFDGTMSEKIDRAVFTSGDAITVLPFDPRAGTVLLIEQFRAGPHARRDPRPWSLETVAGRCDESEPPEATARREAREEANLELGRIERIAAFYPSPGIVAEHITAFVAEADLGARRRTARPGRGARGHPHSGRAARHGARRDGDRRSQHGPADDLAPLARAQRRAARRRLDMRPQSDRRSGLKRLAEAATPGRAAAWRRR